MPNLRARLLGAATVLFVLLPGLALADDWTWRDRDDLDRRLSIHSVTAGHDEEGPTVTVTFDRALRAEDMGEKDFVIVAIESDGEEPNEEWIYLVSIDGQLQRFSYNPHSEETYQIADYTWSQPIPESVTFKVTAFSPGHSHAFFAGSYTETAPGCAEGCWDKAPNRGGLIHDWTPPWVHAVREPSTWTYQRTLKFYWEASDYGLSGFRSSTLLMSTPGSKKWEPIARRNKPGRYVVFVRPLTQGSNVMLRPVAVDGAKNKTLGPIRRTRVPYDQTNPKGGRTFTGKWAEEATTSFGGTVHTSTAPMDTFSYKARGTLYCFHGWWREGVRATFEVGGETVEIDTLAGGSASGFPTCIETETAERRTATLTVHEGRVSVDWYWAGIYPPATDTAEDEPAAREGHLVPTSTAPSARAMVNARRSLSR